MYQPEVIAAFIATIGAIVSVIISYFTSSRNVKIELRKHQEQIMQEFGQKLFEKRINCYPKLYSIVCRYARDLKENTMTDVMLNEYYKEVSDWDVNNSIFMSAVTHNLFHLFRIELLKISKTPKDEIMEKLKSAEFRKDLRRTSNKVELVLKNELGIYSFESPDKVNPGISFESYNEADSHVKSMK